MSLKDDLLRQKQEEDNKKAHAAEIKAEADRLAKEAADKKKEAEELSNAERLDRLQKDLDSGNIPKDYQELYDRFVERIKAEVLAGKTSFEFKEDIEESFALLGRKMPAAWTGKDATYSTGCTKEMRIALEMQAENREMQIIGPEARMFMRRGEYGVGKYFDAALNPRRHEA